MIPFFKSFRTAMPQNFGSSKTIPCINPRPRTFLILAGNVELSRGGNVELTVGAGEDLGVWALFDGEPHAFTARATENTHALKINREDFYDLLADHMDIIQALFRTLVKRVRRLLGEKARAGTAP